MSFAPKILIGFFSGRPRRNNIQTRNGYLRVGPESEESLRVLVANLHKTQPLILEEKCWGGFFLECNSD